MTVDVPRNSEGMRGRQRCAGSLLLLLLAGSLAGGCTSAGDDASSPTSILEPQATARSDREALLTVVRQSADPAAPVGLALSLPGSGPATVTGVASVFDVRDSARTLTHYILLPESKESPILVDAADGRPTGVNRPAELPIGVVLPNPSTARELELCVDYFELDPDATSTACVGIERGP